MKRIILAVVLVVLSLAVAQVSSMPTASTNPKVRAITGFVRLDRATYQKQIVDALVVLRRVKAEFESSGYEVQSVRVTTQPLAELVAGMSEGQALTFLGQLDEFSVKENFLPNVGPEAFTTPMILQRCTSSKGRFRLFRTSRAVQSSRTKLAFIGKQFVAPLNS